MLHQSMRAGKQLKYYLTACKLPLPSTPASTGASTDITSEHNL
jgi:hypothetical protein